jgi:TPR repeat protein
MRNSAFVAAEHEDAEAQSALGAMFATGRCVELDLPSAYHWLSRAARNDPANPGVASELRIVWREMTAQQQQAALHGSR